MRRKNIAKRFVIHRLLRPLRSFHFLLKIAFRLQAKSHITSSLFTITYSFQKTSQTGLVKSEYKLRKNAGSKKREKALEISRFLAVWLAKRLFPSLGSELTCQYGRAAGYSPTAKIPPPAAGKCEPTHLRPAQMPGRTVDPPANRKATLRGGFSVGWGGRIRTDGCGSQSPVPYRLATPQNYRLL